MDYDGLTSIYWRQQTQRVESVRASINQRSVQDRPLLALVLVGGGEGRGGGSGSFWCR